MKLFGAGGGGFMVAGHHISYGLLAVLLSVPVAGLAIYQFRSGAIGGRGAVNTGTGGPSVDAAGNILDANGNVIGQATGVSGGGGGGGNDPALAALSGNVSTLSELLRGLSAYSAPAATGPSYISNSYTTITKAADIPAAVGASPVNSPQAAPTSTPGPYAPFLGYIAQAIPGGFASLPIATTSVGSGGGFIP